jgi:hypothetical protein
VLGDTVRTSPLAGLATSLVALLGFVAFYALERVTRGSQGTESDASAPVLALQLGFFATYSGLVTYTLVTKWQAGVVPATLFAVAMGLHLFAADHVLADHFTVTLTGRWRFVLAGGAMGGWLVAVAAQPAGTALVNALTAFLGGAILLNVFVDELPPERHASFGWFVAGLLTYAALLILVTVTGKAGAALGVSAGQFVVGLVAVRRFADRLVGLQPGAERAADGRDRGCEPRQRGDADHARACAGGGTAKATASQPSTRPVNRSCDQSGRGRAPPISGCRHTSHATNATLTAVTATRMVSAGTAGAIGMSAIRTTEVTRRSVAISW